LGLLFRNEIRGVLTSLSDTLRGRVVGRVSVKGHGGVEIVAEPEKIPEREPPKALLTALREIVKRIEKNPP